MIHQKIPFKNKYYKLLREQSQKEKNIMEKK